MRSSHLLWILCLEQQLFVFQFFNKIIYKKTQSSSIFYYAEHTLLNRHSGLLTGSIGSLNLQVAGRMSGSRLTINDWFGLK